jgi:sialidase-1
MIETKRAKCADFSRKAAKSLIPVAILILIGMLLSLNAVAAEEKQDQGKDEEPMFKMQDLFGPIRIPKIVVAPDGSILAFNGCCSIYRRSEDQGETWSEVKEIGPECSGNVVVDRNVGHVLIVDPYTCVIWRSKDNGKTWAEEKIEKIHPNRLGHGTPDGVHSDVYCSESGLTLQHGKHKGRLIMPVRLRPFGEYGKKDLSTWFYHYNSAIFSDDGGKTWRTGGTVQNGTGEGALAELSDGSIYYNSRSHLSTDHRRRIAWSYTGGELFADWSASDELFEPAATHYFHYAKKPSYGMSCGLTRMPTGTTEEEDVLLFTIADNPGGLGQKMTVQASFDREETWPIKRTIPHKGLSGYSSITAGEDGTIYLLFEKYHPTKRFTITNITFAKFNMAWLKAGEKEEP